jgi:protein TonB
LSAAYYHSPELPWSPSPAEQRRFRIITTVVLLGYILISAVSVLIKVPPVDRSEAESLPPRLAKLVIQEKPKAPPPPPPVEEKQPEPEKKTAEPKPERQKETSPSDAEAARKKASHSGLLALSSELASLQQHDLGKLLQDSPLAQANSGPNSYQKEAARRSIVTSQAVKGSGGISTSQLSRDLGQATLAARATTTVESPTLEAEQQTSTGRDGRKAGRSTEQIQLVLDRSKGALYTLYHRALRANPALQGKVVLEITIAPSGEVTDCKVLSAELDDTDLISKLVARIRLLDFSAKDVETTVFTWPIDFLPSS